MPGTLAESQSKEREYEEMVSNSGRRHVNLARCHLVGVYPGRADAGCARVGVGRVAAVAADRRGRGAASCGVPLVRAWPARPGGAVYPRRAGPGNGRHPALRQRPRRLAGLGVAVAAGGDCPGGRVPARRGLYAGHVVAPARHRGRGERADVSVLRAHRAVGSVGGPLDSRAAIGGAGVSGRQPEAALAGAVRRGVGSVRRGCPRFDGHDGLVPGVGADQRPRPGYPVVRGRPDAGSQPGAAARPVGACSRVTWQCWLTDQSHLDAD